MVANDILNKYALSMFSLLAFMTDSKFFGSIKFIAARQYKHFFSNADMLSIFWICIVDLDKESGIIASRIIVLFAGQYVS